MRILFYATYPNQSNGYARVANNITNYLASKENVDLYHFGITAFTQNLIEREIHPNIKLINVLEQSPSKNPYGDDLIIPAIQQIQPDMIFLYNDILVIARMLNQINTLPKTFQIYTYIDLVYEYENTELIQFINKSTDKFFVFSECWKKNLISMGIPESKMFILKHGLDTTKVYKIDQQIARNIIGLPQDDFIILNINRNTHRKAIDITVSSFLKFLKRHNCDSKIKLYLTSNREPSSYDVLELLRVECIQLELDYYKVINEHVLISNQIIMTDQFVNCLYNSCDVGLNTCYGEGFGLCNLEHASVSKPQVMSSTGALRDIFRAGHCKLIEPRVKIYVPPALDMTGGYMEICSSEDFADALDEYYLNKEKKKEDGKFYEEKIPVEYNWNDILKDFYEKHIKNISN
jgi:glycosyltransferase involved in cell wall biosynthesis